MKCTIAWFAWFSSAWLGQLPAAVPGTDPVSVELSAEPT
jgi:hypothetical protein